MPCKASTTSREPTRVHGSFRVRRPTRRHRQPGVTPVTATIERQLKIELPAAGALARPVDDATPALLIEGVTKRFVVGRKKKPVVAVSNVSMRLERGDIHGIRGANGSGKSTLIRLVSGLLTLDEGRV